MQVTSAPGAIRATNIEKPKLPGSDLLVDPPAPTPALARPVLIVPGGNSRSWGLPAVSHYLCFGGQNQYGGSIRSDRLDHFRRVHQAYGGNVFAIEYTRRFGSVEDNSQELTSVIEAVRQATGASEIDVVAECKGALETRMHLQEVGEGVRNVVQIVPPNRGMPVMGDLATMIAQLSESLGLGIDKLSHFPVSAETIDTFKSSRTDLGWGWNPTLERLNADEAMARERQAVHSTTILLGTGRRQLSVLPNRHLLGDDSVPPWSAQLDHAVHFGFGAGDRAGHGTLSYHPGALSKMTEALVNDGQTVKDEHYLADIPSSRSAAAGLALDLAALGGRLMALGAAWNGNQLGPLGYGLAGAAALDGVLDTCYYLNRSNYLQAGISVVQLTGLGCALAGQPWSSISLLLGSEVASWLAPVEEK